MSFVPQVNRRSFMDTSRQYSEGALQARSAMRPNVTTTAPGKTAGGAISAMTGMGMAGAGIGALTAAKGATGLAAIGGPGFLLGGAALGLAGYLLS